MRVLAVIMVLLLACTACSSKTKDSLYVEGMEHMEAANPGAAVVFFKNALEKDGNFLEARFQLAKAYALLGKNDQAEKEFQKVLTQNPSRDEALLELARIGNASGKGAEATGHAEKYISLHPGNPEGLEVLGTSFAVRKDYQKARLYLTEAVKAAPQSTGARLQLAYIDIVVGDLAAARAELEEVLKSSPREFRAMFMMAKLEARAGNLDKAADWYEKILQVDGNQTVARYKLGLLNLEKHELEKAAAVAERLFVDFPKRGEGYRLKGLVAFHKKRYDEAITHLQQSIKLAPTLEAYHFLGLSYYNKGELETALSQFRVILDRVPNARHARLMTAQTLLAQKRTEDGIAEIKRVLAADDEDAAAHNLLGTAYMSQGLFEEGMRELNRATKLDPKLVNAHLKKGAFYFAKGRNAEGETELATAVQAAPDVLNSRLLLASYHQSQKKPDKAFSVLRAGLKGGPSDAPLQNAIATLQFAAGRKGEGVKSLELAKRLDPSFPGSYLNLAGVYAAGGDYSKAVSELTTLLGKDPKNLRAIFGLAALSELAGKDAEALDYYRKGADTGSSEGLLALAAYHQKKGDVGKALDVLDQAIEQEPRSVLFLEAKGRLLVNQKDYRQALKVFDEVEMLDRDKAIGLKIGCYVAMKDGAKAIEQAGRLVSKRPGSPQGYLLLASVYQSLGDLSSAIGEANKAIRADGKNAEARLVLGGLHQARNEYDKALVAYQEALRLKPESAQSSFSIGALYDVMGKRQEAAAKYRAALGRNDSFVPALNNLAYLCADGYGEKQEALRLAIKAFRLQPNNPSIMDTVGYALVRNGRPVDAVRVMERAAKLLPADPTVSYHLGLAYNLAGENEKSRQALQKSLSLGAFPDTEAARVLLAKLKH